MPLVVPNSESINMSEHPASASLLDLLPCRTADSTDTVVWRTLAIALAPEVSSFLQVAPERAPAWLCAALVATESACTGAGRVAVCRADHMGLRLADCDVNADTPLVSLVDQAMSALQPMPSSPAMAWLVLDKADALADIQAREDCAPSVWWWSSAEPEALRLCYRAPLGESAVAIISEGATRALSAMSQASDIALRAIDVLGADQRRKLLHDWNDAPARRAGPDTLAQRFAILCAATPDALAVIDNDGAALSYRDLGRQASAVARRLQDAGVVAGDRVAVAMQRSAAAIVAVLGVLKAGAAYLPLDTEYPAERLSFMLSDAGVSVALVGSARDAALLPASLRCLALDDVAATATAELSNATTIDGDALAYVMYTSGSTGTPKGVEVTQRGVIRLVCGANYLNLDCTTRLLHAAPLGFDASTLEIWGALLNGGCVVVHPEPIPSSAGLAASIQKHRVTSAWLTAALFNAVVDDDPHCLDGLQDLITGGEALSVQHVRRMRECVPQVRLHNGYGPTECTTFTCTYAVDEVPADALSIPIGRPITDTRVYILNARRQPVPIGVLGELYVGGAGLARGYRNRPELTEASFVADPFGAPGDRLYRSGDRVRYRADGAIEFVGRGDGQVKIRGHRIELPEIEAVLARHPLVRSCAVLARADRPGDKRLVAYVVGNGAGTLGAAALRAHLAATLPDFMLPSHYLQLRALPVTANGKLDWRALPAPDRGRPELASAYAPPVGEHEHALCRIMADLLDIERVGRHDNFFELGGNSLLAMRLLEHLRRIAGELGDGVKREPLAVTAIFQHPSPEGLAALLAGGEHAAIDNSRLSHAHRRTRSGARVERSSGDEPIAIVAMSGRFPGAADVEAFWENLCAGRDNITWFGPGQLDPSIDPQEHNDPTYVAARGVIDGVEDFDAGFFGIAPRQADLMDPQHRLFLELCWECLERAGHAPDSTEVPVGVFAGMNNATYFQRHVLRHPDLIEKVGAFQVMLDNEKDFITTRVAHKLNLTGPAISVHTACSTSLVAICQAVDSLRNGQCDMALAGGVSITCPPRSGYHYQEGAMLSPDGRTRTFDAKAQGTVFSDGAAVLLLKRLSDARADGNPVIALIRGGAVNNDGGNKASFTAPSSEGQAAVIAMALDNAGVDASSIGYVETHGTATPVGDPIEIEGLRKAYADRAADSTQCRIGSLKSNVGHLVIAAGAASAIKVALALQQGRIPASIHFESANPDLALSDSPFRVQTHTGDWPDSAAPRRAGVSSFGVGGTNAHVILEQAAPEPSSDPADGAQCLVLSARSVNALAMAANRLAEHLQQHPETNLADVAYTLSVGRKAFAYRLSVVATDAAQAATMLRGAETAALIARSRPAHANDVVFMFPGQGSQYPSMGRALHASEPAFHDALEECFVAMHGELAVDLRQCLFGNDGDALLPTAVMQPAIFAIEYSLARWWMSLGVKPAALIGHSVGEFVAATVAGVFTLADAIRLVARRGALMQAQPSGAMLSVRLGVEPLLPRLPASLSLAAENAPSACVVAGPAQALSAFQLQLEADGVACRPLRTSHAFHSAMMDDVVEPFRQLVAATPRQPPRLPLMSTAQAEWLDDAQATSPEYWASHLRRPVRFAPALAKLLDVPGRVLLEVGPRATLSTLARQQPAYKAHHVVAIASLNDAPQGEGLGVLSAAGQLWVHGIALDLTRFDRRVRRHRLRLPTYPFERQRCWVEAVNAASAQIIPHPAIAAVVPMESSMPIPASTPASSATPSALGRMDRKPQLLSQLRELFEDVAGFDMADAEPSANFIELGLDSLMLTQVALQLQKTFSLKITFRQLMGEAASLNQLAALLDAQMPEMAAPVSAATAPAAAMPAVAASPYTSAPTSNAQGGADYLRSVIDQQMQLMAQQLALLSGNAVALPPSALPAPSAIATTVSATPQVAPAATAAPVDEEAALAHTRYDVKKAFGAIARIDTAGKLELSSHQRQHLDAFMARYIARTIKSKDYTQAHRPHMADPRVVNGFRPLTKEIVYQIVIGRSKGAHLWDLDGNDYVDALNGFGMSLFGWQPDFVLDAVREQLDLGYEIGPQHPLAGEVAKRICEVTGHDRAALCNTGSEAVLGTLRIARTVTGRETVVVFNGAYHGIIDEMIVRGTKKLRAVPAAPGILRNTAEHVMVLEYGTPESLQIIREHAHELAAVLVEPVQSRRPDFQPLEFLKELRQITQEAGALCIFDEVVTGFRVHPAGAQGHFGIQADLASYGKVVGGGYPIGVIAGKREYMDALDGGQWQFGDDSIPTVGVTYFAGTFVRHPLALAAANAVLQHVQEQGPSMQECLNTRVTAFADELNAFFAEVGAPISVKHFASVWKTQFLEDHPLQDLLFAMMRSRGIHILDNFPCFYTTAHSEADFQQITQAYKDSVIELQEAEFLPRHAATTRTVMDANHPPVPGARLGREPDGRPAWFVANPEQPGQYLKVAR